MNFVFPTLLTFSVIRRHLSYDDENDDDVDNDDGNTQHFYGIFISDEGWFNALDFILNLSW